MMTHGGEHAEKNIPIAIKHVQVRHPQVSFEDAWLFQSSDVAEFLAKQINRFV